MTTLKKILDDLDKTILGIKSKTPSEYAVSVAKNKGVKRTYSHNVNKIKTYENALNFGKRIQEENAERRRKKKLIAEYKKQARKIR